MSEIALKLRIGPAMNIIEIDGNKSLPSSWGEQFKMFYLYGGSMPNSSCCLFIFDVVILKKEMCGWFWM